MKAATPARNPKKFAREREKIHAFASTTTRFRTMPRLVFLIPLLAATLAFAPAGFAQAINLDTTIRTAGAQKNTSNSNDWRRWKIGNYTVEAQDKKPYVTIDGTRVYTGRAVSVANGKIFIQQRDWEKHLRPIVAPARTNVPSAKKIVIDAGHGGKDPGKINTRGMREKTYALDIARRLQRTLTARGYNVIMTRSRDEFLELSERAERANAVGADVFVSLHFNAAGSTSARGIETFMLTPVGEASFAAKNVKTDADPGNAKDAWNLLLAYKVHSALVNKIDAENRGVKCMNLAVLRPLKCPGILVECGFFTNASEAALIATTNRREQIAQGIADGISAYAGTLGALAPKPAPRPPPRRIRR